MDVTRSALVEELFFDALDLPPDARAAFLAERCGDDVALLREVRGLLDADAAAEADPRTSDATRFLPSGEFLADALATSGDDPWIGRHLGPWELTELLGEGGMGRVFAARRTEGGFEQRAAVKVLRGALLGEQAIARFEHERRTLARLEHPGLARLLDGGTAEASIPWLAMERVDGEPIDDFCDRRLLSVEERVGLLAKVCDAVAFAHSRLVVHRDLKPSNVVVEASGAPRLLDFGIAKVLDDELDPGVTLEGGVPRTPGYASPEQVRGEVVGPASDVYSLGVMLHELLTGRSPYRPATDTAAATERAVLEQTIAPPSRLPSLDAAARGLAQDALRRRLSGDLDNIVLKALAKEPERRYATAAELADDLRRHLAGLPVHARAPTLRYRTAKFVRRHRAASALGAALVALAIVAAVGAVQSLRRDSAQLGRILRLSDAYDVDGLRAEADALWPPRPGRRVGYDDWIARAEALLARRPAHAATLAELDARLLADPSDGQALWWRGQLARLLDALDALGSDDAFGPTLAGVRRRRGLVDTLERASLLDASAAWEAARASIADVAECPAYGGLELAPQWGLVPWRKDPRSGLWEFVVAGTGDPPGVGDDGAAIVGDGTGVVLVLVPGGTTTVGAQKLDASSVGYDELAEPNEFPPHEVALEAFFLAKHELTQGQWLRLAGRNPSFYPPPGGSMPITLAHPVEQMSWDEAVDVLRRVGLVLPTEAQWEHAARAGTTTPWSSGKSMRTLDRVANVADLFARDHQGSPGWNYVPAQEADLDDGFTLHAPVGSFLPNAFGLHDVHGNVWEWCRDFAAPYASVVTHPDGRQELRATDADPVDGLLAAPSTSVDDRLHVLRGGSFGNPPSRARSAARWDAVASFRTQAAGVRAARAVER